MYLHAIAIIFLLCILVGYATVIALLSCYNTLRETILIFFFPITIDATRFILPARLPDRPTVYTLESRRIRKTLFTIHELNPPPPVTELLRLGKAMHLQVDYKTPNASSRRPCTTFYLVKSPEDAVMLGPLNGIVSCHVKKAFLVLRLFHYRTLKNQYFHDATDKIHRLVDPFDKNARQQLQSQFLASYFEPEMRSLLSHVSFPDKNVVHCMTRAHQRSLALKNSVRFDLEVKSSTNAYRTIHLDHFVFDE